MTKLDKVLNLTKLQAKVLFFIENNTGLIDGWYHTISIQSLKNKMSASNAQIRAAVKCLIGLELVEQDEFAAGRAFKYSTVIA